MLDRMLPKNVERKPWAGAIVPHAGWMYSGKLAAETLARIEIPSRVIVVCPKHRADGADWAVAPHRAWAIPGGEVAGDTELAGRLAECVQGLVLDGEAHREEHAIEVQLPILARLAPKTRVVGIAVRRRSGSGCGSRAIADVIRRLPERPLLLVSSDMNHFADDAADAADRPPRA